MKEAPRRIDLVDSIVVLGAGRSAVASPSGDAFWQQLMSGGRPDVEEGWLVSLGSSVGTWPMWEMHPEGEEIVMLLQGKGTLVLEHDGATTEHELDRRGQLVIIPRGTWHYATSERRVDLLFVTAGKGTKHRPRALDGGA